LADWRGLGVCAPVALTAAGVTAAASLVGAPMALALALGAGAGVGVSRWVAPRPDPAPAPAAPRGKTDALPPGVGRDLLERLPLGLLLLDESSRVMFQNAAALEMLERRVTDMPAAAALRAPALTEAVAAAYSHDRASDLDVTLLRGKDRVVHAAIRPLTQDRVSDGRAPTVLVMLEDRTRAAKAEALRRDFVANASHELKTPLASISGFIETLQGHAKNDPEATERFLAIMARQAARMKRLVDDLLSLNRIEINEHVRPRHPVDLAALAWEISAGLAPQAAAEGARFAVELPRGGLSVLGERDELAQVFVNLLDNAVKYAGSAGPIRVHLADPADARPGMVGVTIADSGPGIPREHLPRLTERFYRVDVARSRERGGTGLGLAIVKHILSRHRGDLTVASAPGQGARFTVWFPALKGAAADAEGTRAAS